MTTIVKATTKGQITLPASWRKIFDTDRYIVKTIGKKLEISPLNLSAIENVEEYTVFDAIRDNDGRGIKAKDLVKILNKI
jgi:bifunctional DNA-binding transcriptional regulator/antitoxin component of YhaV-PrlF toxin-antitoxin module